MNDAFQANFEIGNNQNVYGVMGGEAGSKEFSCWSSSYFKVENHSNIFGKTHKNQYISLLNCLENEVRHTRGNDTTYSCQIFSHTMLLGYEKVDPENDRFGSISLTIGNPSNLFRSLKSFGFVNSPSTDLIDALNDSEGTPNFDKARFPIIAYFNGEFSIFKQETKLGIIEAHNIVSSGSWGSPTGVNIENKVLLTIHFQEEVSLDEAFKRANLVSCFFRFIGSDGLYFRNITLRKAGDDQGEFIVHHDSYNWGKDSEGSYCSGPLIDVTHKRFQGILKSWFEKDDRQVVRYSFYSTFFRSTYSSDRLITAANMFDIFPRCQNNASKSISAEERELLKSLKCHVKSEFSNYEDTKSSLLQAIGFVTRKSLKERVMERIELLRSNRSSLRLGIENLEYIIGIAIKCRNYFVHGTEPKNVPPEKFLTFQALFIETFEYIYAASELVECGWDSDCDAVLATHHKIRIYEQLFDSEFKRLKKTIGQ